MQGTLSLEDIVRPRSKRPAQGPLSLEDIVRSGPPAPTPSENPFAPPPADMGYAYGLGDTGSPLPPGPPPSLGTPLNPPGPSLAPPEFNPENAFAPPGEQPPSPLQPAPLGFSSLGNLQQLATAQYGAKFPFARQTENEIRGLGGKKSLGPRSKTAGLVPDDHKLSADEKRLLDRSLKLAPDRPLGKPFTWDELANDPRKDLPLDDPRRDGYEQDLLKQRELIGTNEARRKAFLAKADRNEWKLDDWIQYGMSLPYQMDFAIMYDPALREKYRRLNAIATGQPVKDFGDYLKEQPVDKIRQMNEFTQLERDRKALAASGSQNPMDIVTKDDVRAEVEKNLPTRLAESFGTGLAEGVRGVRDALSQDADSIERRQYEGAYRADVQARADAQEALPYAAKLGRATAESLGYMTPALAAGALTGNPGVTYAMMGSQVGVTDYGTKKAEGWSDKEAILYGLGSAAVETVSEILGGKVAGAFGLQTAEEAATRWGKNAIKRGAIVSPFEGIKQPVVRELVERSVGSIMEGGEEVAANFLGDVRDGTAALLGKYQPQQAQDQLDTFLVGVISGGIMHSPHLAAFVADPTNWNVRKAAGIPDKAFPTREDAVAAAWIARELAKPANNSQNPADEVRQMQLDQLQPPAIKGEAEAWKVAEKLGATRDQFDSMVRNYEPQFNPDAWNDVLRPFYDEARFRKEQAAQVRLDQTKPALATDEQVAELRKRGFRGKSLTGLSRADYDLIRTQNLSPVQWREQLRQRRQDGTSLPPAPAGPTDPSIGPPAQTTATPVAPEPAPAAPAAAPPAEPLAQPSSQSTQAPAPAAEQAKPTDLYAGRKQQLTDRSPQYAEQWLNDAINRSPQGLDAPGVAAWIRKGFGDGNYWTALKKRGQSLDEYVAERMAQSPDGKPAMLEGLGKGLSDNFYKQLEQSLTDSGEVPSTEKGSNIDKLWQRHKDTVSPVRFIEELRYGYPKDAEGFRALSEKLSQKYPARDADLERIQGYVDKAIPEAKATVARVSPTRYRATLGDGKSVDIEEVEQVPISEGTAAKAIRNYGLEDTPEVRQKIATAARGGFRLHVGDKAYDSLGLIYLRAGLNARAPQTLRHELIHFAKQSGAIDDATWKRLAERYAPGETHAGKIEEKIARGLETDPARSWSTTEKIRQFIDRILTSMGVKPQDIDSLARDIQAGKLFAPKDLGPKKPPKPQPKPEPQPQPAEKPVDEMTEDELAKRIEQEMLGGEPPSAPQPPKAEKQGPAMVTRDDLGLGDSPSANPVVGEAYPNGSKVVGQYGDLDSVEEKIRSETGKGTIAREPGEDYVRFKVNGRPIYEAQVQGDGKWLLLKTPEVIDQPKSPKNLGPKKPPKSPPTPKPGPTLADKAAEAKAEYKDAMADLRKILGDQSLLPTTLDPRIVGAVSKVAAKAVKAEVYRFAQFVDDVVKEFGPEVAGRIGNYLEHAWRVVGKLYGDRVDAPTSVTALLESKYGQKPQADAAEPGAAGDQSGDRRGDDRSAAGPRQEDVGAGSPESDEAPQATESVGSRDESGGPNVAPGADGSAGGGDGVPAGEQSGDAGPRRPPRSGGGGSRGNARQRDGVDAKTFRPKTRYADNVAAIKLVKQLQRDGRMATPDEQQILLKYVGWGGLKQVFAKAPKPEWTREAAEIKSLLTPEEWKAAANSTQNAHYTAPKVARVMWHALERLGFKGGRIFEPSMGTGMFFATMPDSIADNPLTMLTGVEKDGITGLIAQHLHQAAEIHVAPFEAVRVAPGSQDLFVGNVPFARTKIADKHDAELKDRQSIHDFFFAKALRGTRPGGLVVMITSRYSLDKTLDGPETRKQWQRMGGDFLGAIRLPEDAFKGNANTSVVTDILVFQKRMPGARVASQPFLNVGEIKQTGYHGFIEGTHKRTWHPGETTFPINEYFVSNPSHILGQLTWTGTMNKKIDVNVERGDVDVEQALGKALDEILARADDKALHEGTVLDDMQSGARTQADWPHDWVRIDGDRIYRSEHGERVEIPVPYGQHEKKIEIRKEEEIDDEGNPTGKIIDVKEEKIVSISPAGEASLKRMQGLIDVFEAAEHLVAAQADKSFSDEQVEQLRADLNRAYDDVVGKFGALNHSRNATFANQASLSMAARLQAIENYDPSTGKGHKTAIFKERTQRPYEPPTKADTAEQAFIYSLANRGGVDFRYMEQLSGKDRDTLINELGDRIFRVPGGETWETADLYLSGNVRHKLRLAEAAAKDDPSLDRNVEALKKAQPEDLSPGQISVRIGSTWIPLEDYGRFYSDTFGKDVVFSRSVATNRWSLDMRDKRPTQKETIEFGTEDRSADEILDRILNNKDLTVRRYIRGGGSYVDRQATGDVLAKAELLQQEFVNWLWKDQDRMSRLSKLYNETINVNRDTEYDGSHLEFPGMSVEWKKLFNSHQRAAVWRYVQTGNMLLGHVVGAGKTATMAAMAMESKRLSGNPHYRTLLAAPKHLVASGQIVKEILEVYPSAKILAATTESLSGRGRRAFLKRMASENYDVIVMAHTSFQRIPLAPDVEQAFINEELVKLEADIDEAKSKSGQGDRNYIAELEAAKDRLVAKIQALSAMAHRDENAVYFDDIGISALFVDEAHLFKNLQVTTRLSRVPGVSTSFSARAFDMLMKTTYFNRATNYRGLVMATGTPIANAVGELYVMQRYLQPQELSRLEVGAFDAWVANFAAQENKPEMDPAGGGMRMKSRLVKYVNLPELMAIFRRVADIKLFEDLKHIIVRPKIVGGKPQRIEAPRNAYMEEYIERLQHRAQLVRSGSVDPSEDNMLNITGDGRRAALDIRLVDPTAPDLADSKLNIAVRNVHSIWKETAEKKLTQLVWMDATSPVDKKPGELDLYREFVDKLVDMGIPRDEIAIIHDFDGKTTKAMFAKVNSGEIRVLLGSTEKMGTGTNVQRLLIAAHHLDVPHRPDQVEQRDGRMERRGNLNEEVRVLRYITKGSFDAISWDRLERKASFIRQALSGRSARVVEELGEDLSAAEMKAAAADNPKLSEYVEADAQLHKLRIEQQGWIDEGDRIARAKEGAKSGAAYNRQRASEIRKAVAWYHHHVGTLSLPEGEIAGKYDGKDYSDPAEMMKDFTESIVKATEESVFAKKTGRWIAGPFEAGLSYNGIQIPRVSTTVDDGKFVDTRRVGLFWNGAEVGSAEFGPSPAGNLSRLRNAIAHILEDNGRKSDDTAAEQEANAAAYEERLAKRKDGWPKRAELAATQARHTILFNETQRDPEGEELIKRYYAQLAPRFKDAHKFAFQIEMGEQGDWINPTDDKPVNREVLGTVTNRVSQEQMEKRLAELQKMKLGERAYSWQSANPERVHAKAKGRAPRSLAPKKKSSPSIAPSVLPAGRKKTRPRKGLGPRKAPQPTPASSTATLPTKQKVTLASITKSIVAIVSPPTASDTAKEGSHIIRKAFAESAQERVAVYHRVKKLARKLGKLSHDDVVDFIDAIELGERQANPELQPAADMLRAVLDEVTGLVQGLGTGVLDQANENYFPHIWKQKIDEVMAWMEKRAPLQGSKSFLKGRTLPTFREGIEAGFEPVDWNPVHITFRKINEMLRYVEAHRVLQEIKGRGLAQFVPATMRTPAGQVLVDDPLFAVYAPPFIEIEEAYDKLMAESLMQAAKNLGLKVERVMNLPGNRWGEASPDGTVRTKFAGPLSVLMHEIGHQLGFKFGLYDWMRSEGSRRRFVTKGPRKGTMEIKSPKAVAKERAQLDAEWRALADLRHEGQIVGPHYKRYVREKEEKEAVLLEAYLHAPERMKKVAPGLYEKFEKFLHAHPQLEPLLSAKPSLVLDVGRGRAHVPGVTKLGHWSLPEDIARLVNNHLGRGLWDAKNDAIRTAYRLWMGPAATLNQFQLSMSGFHGLFTAIAMPLSYTGMGARSVVEGVRSASPKLAARGLLRLAQSTTFAAPYATTLWNGAKLRKAMQTPLEQITDPKLRSLVEDAIAAGMRSDNDRWFFQTAADKLVQTFGEVLRGETLAGKAKAAAKLPHQATFAFMEKTMEPILGRMVPMLKLGMFAVMARDEALRTDRQGGDWAKRITEIADSIDNRLGQVVYDNLFWNRVMKDGLQAGIRAVGWNRGFLAEYLAGPVVDTVRTPQRIKDGDAILSYRQAEVMGTVLLHAAMGAVLQYALTGEPPREWRDYFFPRTGRLRPDGSPERLSLPTYAKDYYAWLTEPLTTAQHKATPIIAALADLYRNEDYYGTKIANEDDPALVRLKDYATYLGKQFLPFSARNFNELRKDGGSTWKSIAIAATGVGVAPAYISRSPAQKLMFESLASNMEQGSRTSEQYDRSQARREIISAMRDNDAEKLKSLYDEHFDEFSVDDQTKMQAEAKQTPFAASFSRLRTPQALRVWQIASDEERAQVADLLVGKFLRTKPDSQQDREAWLDLRTLMDLHWSSIEKNARDTEPVVTALRIAYLGLQEPSREGSAPLAQRKGEHAVYVADLQGWLRDHSTSPLVVQAVSKLLRDPKIVSRAEPVQLARIRSLLAVRPRKTLAPAR